MSDNINMMKNWLVGTGKIAVDYAKVLSAQNITFTPVGRGEESAASFTQKTGTPVLTGGVQSALERFVPETAIVTVGVPDLAETARALIERGVRRILLEKPGGMDKTEIAGVAGTAEKHGAEVLIAYNRRFYSSTLEAEKIIEQDGGVISFCFEFTEWLHQFRAMKGFNDAINMFLANSTHVIDLAFYLGGLPKVMNCYAVNGGRLLDWDSSRIYTGAGISQTGALFSYHADWNAPGRWGVEMLTKNHRLIFRPMEQLHIQKLGSVAIEKADIDDSLDTEYKPGIFREVDAFFKKDGLERFPNIHDQLAHCDIYEKMQQTQVGGNNE